MLDRPNSTIEKQSQHGGVVAGDKIAGLPIREDLFAADELFLLGQRMRSGAPIQLSSWDGFDFPARANDNAKRLLSNYRSTARAAESRDLITPAAEWLLDNHHMVESHARQIVRDLPAKFYNQLPTILLEDGQKVPRSLALAWVFVAHTNSNFDVAAFTALVQGFQTSQVLDIGEIWALPAILRMALLENLRRISDRVENSRKMRAAANVFADEIIQQLDDKELEKRLENQTASTLDDGFSAQLLYRLRDGSHSAAWVLSWLEDNLEARGTDAEECIIAEHARLSMGNLTVGNIIRSLRQIDDVSWTEWFESISHVDRQLRSGSDYGQLDARTRNSYRDVIERVAHHSSLSEVEVTNVALGLSNNPNEQQNIGHFLIADGLGKFYAATHYHVPLSERFARAYLSSRWMGIVAPLVLLTLATVGLGIWFFNDNHVHMMPALCLVILFALPACEAASGFFNYISAAVLKPAHLPGYAFVDGIPRSSRTLVVIPSLISNRDTIDELVRNLEVHYLSNPDRELYFALVTDWLDSAKEKSSGGDELLAYATSEIARLAAKYEHTGSRRFFLLHRQLLWNEAEGVWMGWERKRGKLHELNLLLRGDHNTTFIQPDDSLPTDIKFVLTLDSDTRLPRDSVRELVGKLSHPLNVAVIEPASQTVRKGYSILQPRVTPSLTTGSQASVFQRTFSLNRGLDPYSFTVSDLYQDFLGEGTFTGKGLYNIDAFEAAMAGRIPENSVLSHDLLEGSFARAALVTDVEFVEDYPIRYDVDVSRQHRWVRGDWQLVFYIFNFANGLPAIARFKMLDNLRRSLTPIVWVIGSIAAWLLLPLGAAATWQTILIISIFVAPTLSLFNGLIPVSSSALPGGYVRTLGTEVANATAQVALRVVFMAHLASVMADAIVRTLFRLFISRRHMLEWKTAQQAHAAGGVDIRSYYRAMWQSPAIGIVVALLVTIFGKDTWIIADAFALLWIMAPALAWFVSQTAKTEDALVLSQSDEAALRIIARKTWRYFERFVSAESNFLPPDNFQEVPLPVVAERTSPTNIGMYLLSTIAARDFGWISLFESVERIEHTLTTVEKMQRFRGHLYNWYDTRNLSVMHPSYISTVDSGNMAGHLISVSSALKSWGDAPAVHLMGDTRGIGDVAAIVKQSLALVADDRRSIRPLRSRLIERLAGFEKTYERHILEPELAPLRSINLSLVAGEVVALASDLNAEVKSNQSQNLLQWTHALHATCEAHFNDASFDRAGLTNLRDELLTVAERARKLAFEMEFSFLLNPTRKLLSIGYRVDEQQLDESCYDLLASEARLTSLFAIAKGDVPNEHWFHLGRPIVAVNWQAALVSWSGSMFEYLMPSLVMHERQGGLLNQSNRLAVRRQIAYAKERNVPWGISESAFNARDREMNYQYRNFGVPSLGLKHDLVQDLVIAPYASALAAQFFPSEAVQNYARLTEVGAEGAYGFYDAIDFTPSRLQEGEAAAVVQNYMAHHQGMTITAIANAVFDGVLRDRFHADPVIEAAELLLQEKPPHELVPVKRAETSGAPSEALSQLQRSEIRLIENPRESERQTILLSNGHYSTMITATGAGYSRWNGLAVTRWQADPTFDLSGTFIFLRDLSSGQTWSATPAPRSLQDETSHTIFSDDKAEFHKVAGTITSRLECLVTSEFDGEGRRITLTNTSKFDRLIEVTSYTEPVLASAQADAAHPAFSKMFVKTEIGADRNVIYVSRNRRTKSDPDICVAHMIADAAPTGRETQAETDRRLFIGRGRDITNAAAFDHGARLTGSQGFTLDPCLSLRRIVRVPAGKEVKVTFWTIAAPNRETVDAAVANFRHSECFAQELHLAWSRSQVQQRHTDITSSEAALFQQLATHLIFPDTLLSAADDVVAGGIRKQSALWPLGISGDNPIFALRIDDEGDLPILRQAFRSQEYLRSRGIVSDLVVINERAASYAQNLQGEIDAYREAASKRGLASGPGQHIFTVRRDLMDAETYQALLAAARILFHARNGTISEQLLRIKSKERAGGTLAVHTAFSQYKRLYQGKTLPDFRPEVILGEGLHFWNGYGGFDPKSRDYVVRLASGSATPQPWINVITNPDFGFHISAEGAAFTWSKNSRDYQLTPWSNDPVTNRPGEAFYIRDLLSGEIFAPQPALSHGTSATYETRHSPGKTTITMEADGLISKMTHIMAGTEPAKVTQIEITNNGSQERRLRIFAYAELVLGNDRARNAPHIELKYDSEAQVLTASNPYSMEFAGRTAFLASDFQVQSFTASRGDFFGKTQDIKLPECVTGSATLNRSTDTLGDPCAVLACDLVMPAGTTRSMTFVLGDADKASDVAGLVARLRTKSFEDWDAHGSKKWEEFLSTIQVETPDEAFNLMVNTWLPYQSMACRIEARSAFYQASGAFGFRDQLQDTASLLMHNPDIARTQILSAAGRQFVEGDVQHWWLPATGAGVRTTISDDIVWLGYLTSHYINATGNSAILDEQVPFIAGPKLQAGEHDAFFQPEPSGETGSLYEHCARGLDLAVKRTGPNNLPLIMGGDWNDGMNRVGEGGKGESVWLAWLLLDSLQRFDAIASARGDDKRVAAWRAHAKKVKLAVEKQGWDGAWYRRGSFDDGTLLGSSTSDDCKIDSIAQSWSVLSGKGDPIRAGLAMDNVMAQLIDKEQKIIRLFTPPFEHTDKEPGYIKGYPPGVRENGGQYTHAATWVAYALAKIGRLDEAWQAFDLINPINHALSKEAADAYRVEPYVVAADVYGADTRTGRGGWTWYTGSSGWLYRAAIEAILGIELKDGKLTVNPRIPSHWDGYTARVHFGGKAETIIVKRVARTQEFEISRT